MNSDLQTQTSQEEVEMALQLDHQDYNSHSLHTHPGYTSQVIPRPHLVSRHQVIIAIHRKVLDWSAN